MTDPLYTVHTSTLDATPSLPTDVEPCGCDHSQLREAQLIDALLASVRAQERAEQYRAECDRLRRELEALREVSSAAKEWRRYDESDECDSDFGRTRLDRLADAVDALNALTRPDPASVPGHMVEGDFLDSSLARFQHRADVLLQELQEQPNPPNHLIAFICDAVRLSRENTRLARTRLGVGTALAPAEDAG